MLFPTTQVAWQRKSTVERLNRHEAFETGARVPDYLGHQRLLETQILLD